MATTSSHAMVASVGAVQSMCYSQVVAFLEWHTTMDLEFNALLHNHTWRLVHSHLGMNVIGCKWVFRVKQKKYGSVEHHKVRLVAKGFNQVAGEDFFNTFSSVVNPTTTIRLLLSLALSNNWAVRHLDVHNAFLNGHLSETVYMCQPWGYVDKFFPNHVYLL